MIEERSLRALMHWRFWRTLLFEAGQGWLRWGTEERTAYYWESNACAYAPEWYRVAPPLHRLWLYVRQWFAVPHLMLIGVTFDGPPPRYRYSWEEARPCWPTDMRDNDDRRKELWRQ